MSANLPYDVVVIGAGAAGLAAASRLQTAGIQTIVLEARDRIGGRILTDRTRVPMEMGASFIHGRNAATWSIIRAAGLATVPVVYNPRVAHNGRLRPQDDGLLARVEELAHAIEHYSGPDRGVAQLVADLTEPDDPAASLVLRRYANMEAADVGRLSALSLTRERAENIAGWDNFLLVDGYDAIPRILATGLKIRLQAAVTHIAWDERGAMLTLDHGDRLHAHHVVVTVPLSLLQRERPAFTPPLPEATQGALASLAMGMVTKLLLWFNRAFWEPEALGILSTDGTVTAWWPAGNAEAPALLGYAGGPWGAALGEAGAEEATAQGLDELTALFGSDVRQHFVEGRMVDWTRDPWSRGGYSYTPVGAGDARARLAEPIGGTIFLAGEATAGSGHLATVHGAIESGWRAADQILAAHPLPPSSIAGSHLA